MIDATVFKIVLEETFKFPRPPLRPPFNYRGLKYPGSYSIIYKTNIFYLFFIILAFVYTHFYTTNYACVFVVQNVCFNLGKIV